MGAGDKLAPQEDDVPVLLEMFSLSYQFFLPTELFIGEFIPKGKILIMIRLLKTAFLPLT